MSKQHTPQNFPAQAQGEELDLGSDLAGLLRELIGRGDRGIDWIETKRLGLNVRLHLAVRELRERFGLAIRAELERTTTDAGTVTSAARYRLAPQDVAKARNILGLPPEALPAMTPALRYWQAAYGWTRNDR